MLTQKHYSIGAENIEDIKADLREQVSSLYHVLCQRYYELLPTLIEYQSDTVRLDSMKIEQALRHGYNVVIGKNKKDITCILGFTQNTTSSSTNLNILQTVYPVTEEQVTFTIPENLRPKKLKEITFDDPEGNCFILRNRPPIYIGDVSYASDMQIVKQFIKPIAEVYKLRMKTIKDGMVTTFIKGEQGDESITQIANELYSGAPFAKISGDFEPEEDIVTVNNIMDIVNSLPELKREYQNRINELNTILGIQNLGIDKESGVSDLEAKSGDPWTTCNSNIYLKTRQRMLDLWEDVTGEVITAQYDSTIAGGVEEEDVEDVGDDETNDADQNEGGSEE